MRTAQIGIITNRFPSLSETFIVNKVLGLEESDIRVTVCVYTNKSDIEYYADNSIIQKVKIINISSRLRVCLSLGFHPLKAILWFLKLKKRNSFKHAIRILFRGFLIKLQKFDIIHFEFSGIGVTHLDLLDFYKPAKLFVSCRGSAEKVKPLTDLNRGGQLKILFQKCDKVHCVSIDMFQGLQQYGLTSEKHFVNYPSVDIAKYKNTYNFKFVKKDKWEFVTTGRLHFSKGYIYCLQALKILKELGYKFNYHILGDGPDLPMLKYLTSEWELSNEITFHGKVGSKSIIEILSLADIFILPSLYEGVANGALEAMAMGIPIVTTNAGGMAEVVYNKDNGMIVNRFSGFDLATAIEELLISEELRQKVSENGRRTIEEKFNIQNQIKIFLDEYRQSLQ